LSRKEMSRKGHDKRKMFSKENGNQLICQLRREQDKAGFIRGRGDLRD